MATPPSNVQSSSKRKSLGYEPNAGGSSADGSGSFECESFEQDAKKQRLPSSSHRRPSAVNVDAENGLAHLGHFCIDAFVDQDFGSEVFSEENDLLYSCSSTYSAESQEQLFGSASTNVLPTLCFGGVLAEDWFDNGLGLEDWKEFANAWHSEGVPVFGKAFNPTFPKQGGDDDDDGFIIIEDWTTHYDPTANVDVPKRPLPNAHAAMEKCIRQAYKLAMNNARNAKQNVSFKQANKMMHDHLDALYHLLPENLRALVRQWSKGNQAGLYVLLKELYIKIGESGNLEERTAMQDYIERLVLLYQSEIDEKGYAPDDLVDRLLQLQLPMLNGHDISRAKRTRNKIKRQIVELIFHAVYDIKINPAFEFIFQTPDEDLRLVTDTAAFKSSLRAHLDFPIIDARLGRCDKVMDNPWRSELQ